MRRLLPETSIYNVRAIGWADLNPKWKRRKEREEILKKYKVKKK